MGARQGGSEYLPFQQASDAIFGQALFGDGEQGSRHQAHLAIEKA